MTYLPRNSTPNGATSTRKCQATNVFTAWKDKFQKNIVDMGGKLGGGKVVTSEGATDGPFVEAKEVVGGFMIVSAESLEEATQVARECPGVVMPGSSVEVRQIHTP